MNLPKNILLLATLFFALPAEALEVRALCNLILTNVTEKDSGNYQSTRVGDGTLRGRPVKFQVPKGVAPPGGWPAVVLFQGSFFPVKFGRPSEQYGLENEARLIELLLQEGFAVIAPRAIVGLGWQTNVLPFSFLYKLTSDYLMMKRLLAAGENGEFGAIDMTNLFATGISSGGYQSSRVGEAFPGKFRALAIHSASYATCLGPLCNIPEKFSSNHPPTLLISGDADKLVPSQTAVDYYESLKENKIEAKLRIKKGGRHTWFSSSPGLIVNWFKDHLIR